MAHEAKCAKCSIEIARNGIWGGVVYCVGCRPAQYSVSKISEFIPEFKIEAEEAAWWDSHPHDILGVFEQAAKDGTLGRGTIAAKEKANASIQR